MRELVIPHSTTNNENGEDTKITDVRTSGDKKRKLDNMEFCEMKFRPCCVRDLNTNEKNKNVDNTGVEL